MKFQRSFDNQNELAIIDVVGVPSPNEWSAAVAQCPRDDRLLIDIRGAKFSSLGATELADLAHQSRRLARSRATRVAMVADQDADYGMARRWSVLREAPNVATAAFRTCDEAIEWLKDAPVGVG